MASIKQKPVSPVAAKVSSLPDFRNLGVMLRVLLVVNLAAMFTVLIKAEELERFPGELMLMAGRVELPLFVVLLTLYVLAPMLMRLSPLRAGCMLTGVVLGVVFALWPTLATHEDNPWRWALWALGAVVGCLFYFDYRNLLYSPALTEARLLALTARIRPHFLFNSLNAVLGVIRTDTRLAEQSLEELADLFRVFMRDNRGLVPLGDEIALCERYLNLERLRLGDKLRVRWSMKGIKEGGTLNHVRVPPLLLQPLIENAVYHGIEPAVNGGDIVIRLGIRSGRLVIEVDNSIVDDLPHHSGNKMAMDNIRERLMLYYDLEAALTTMCRDDRYRVKVQIPLRRPSK
jgi:two-component system sensor histidine kinase AlgZ